MTQTQERILQKLKTAWEVSPHLSFGQLAESIDNTVWELVPNRHCSARMMNIPDELFESTLDLWIRMPAVRKPLYT